MVRTEQNGSGKLQNNWCYACGGTLVFCWKVCWVDGCFWVNSGCFDTMSKIVETTRPKMVKRFRLL